MWLSTGRPLEKPISTASPGKDFALRNSGINAVVEGVGDHGCEYMTGGKVIILGKTGRNFAAGMSGGIAYVLDFDSNLCNPAMVECGPLVSKRDKTLIRSMLSKHVEYTGSAFGRRLLEEESEVYKRFTKVIPSDYRKMLENIEKAQIAGYRDEEALMKAFEDSFNDVDADPKSNDASAFAQN